jgi:hypothetical protein
MQGFGAVAVLNLAVMSGNVGGVHIFFPLGAGAVLMKVNPALETSSCLESSVHVGR